jgi:GGDEF domain-containing protein
MALRQSLTPTSIPVAVVPDIVTIPGYLLLLAAMIRLVRARQGTAPGGALDGGLMAVGGLLVSWSVVITPVFHTVGMPTAIKVVNVAYPTISVAILFVAALLAMNESTSIPAFWCLAGAWCSLIVGDVVYALASIGTTPVPLWVGNTGYCAFYALLGAAALDPSMVDLSRPTTKRVRPYGLSRFMAVAVALVLPAIVVAIHASNNTTERLIDGAFLAVLGSLVFARMARAVNRHAQSEQRLERLANHDTLTGMANRLQLETHLAGVLDQARLARTGVGVIFLDLDNFKNVNDNWGHQTGDELLQVIATRLQSSLRPGELAARVGGDEFIVVCAGLRTNADAAKIADRVLRVLDEVVRLPN